MRLNSLSSIETKTLVITAVYPRYLSLALTALTADLHEATTDPMGDLDESLV
jgi:hypothetical protein